MKRLNAAKKSDQRHGQSMVEYLLIMSVILVALLTTDFIGRMRNGFEIFFNNATSNIVP